MIFKLCFNNEIHRVSKAIPTFKALKDTIEMTFKGMLPTLFQLKYVDADGDRVMIGNNDDFKSMLECMAKNKSIKVYVNAIDESEVSFSKENTEIMSKAEESEILDMSSCKAEEPSADDSKVKNMVEDALFQQIPNISLLVKDFLAEAQAGVQKKQQEKQPKKEQEQPKMVHHRIICDGCNMNPIIGTRYKCAVSDDYDLCENCEAKMNHPYPMLKIKDPKFHPVALICAFDEIALPEQPVQTKMPVIDIDLNKKGANLFDMAKEKYSELSKDTKSQISKIFKGIPEKLEETINHLIPKPESPKPAEKKAEAAPVKKTVTIAEPEYGFNFVKEISTIPSKITVKDLVIYKTINIKNTGKVEWPRKTFLIPDNEIRGQKANLIALAPGKEMSAVLIIDSPREAGSYFSVWKLAYEKDGETKTIGEPFFLEFEIMKPANEKDNKNVYAMKLNEQAPKKVEAPKKPVEKKVVIEETPKPVVKNTNETPMGYSDMCVSKVKMMKSIFNDADVTVLLDYVKPFEQLSIEELIEGFLAMSEQREAEEAERKKKEAEEAAIAKKKAEEEAAKKAAEEEAARKKREASSTPKGDITPGGETPRGENPKGFTDDVVKKVKALKMLFNEADVAILLDFVASSPEDAEVDDLVEEYLAVAEENNQLLKALEESKKTAPKVVEEPKFDEKVVAKAKLMKEIFSETDVKELCKFISNVPEDMTLDELVESYLQ